MKPPHPIRSFAARATGLGVLSLLWLACGGEDLVQPMTGEITVTVSTTGTDPDTDGYTLSLDGLDGVAIESNATRTLSVDQGNHTLELGGLAANCGVEGGVQQTITVGAGDTAVVAFEVICSATTGGLTVVASTTGEQPDADGYSFTIDDGAPRSLDANGSVTVTGLPTGDHTVELSGVAGNCTLAGDNPRTATVPSGDLVELTFAVTCSATAGSISITTSTGGVSPDHDGYTVQVDDAPGQPIGVEDTVIVAELAPGDHTVKLGGVAANCTVEGDNPRTVAVVVGETASAEFTIACTAGVQQWTPMRSGTRADLPEVWGTSATDVFVVGELEISGDFNLASTILHYDGQGWTPQLQELDLRLRGIWGSGPDDVFAVGFGFFAPGARVLHYDGAEWSDVPGFPMDPEEDVALVSVWGSSADDVFAVGSTFNGLFDESLIFHFNGSRWRRMQVEGQVAPGLNDVWGSSATDVYAVGRDGAGEPSRGVIMHFDGADWSPVLEEEGLVLNSVWGSSATDVFAAGFDLDESDDDAPVTGTIMHYDGTRWSRMSIPNAPILQEIWGSSGSDVFAVGGDGVVLHYDGVGWTSTNPTTATLLGVWGSSPSDVFAVGNGGTILHGTP